MIRAKVTGLLAGGRQMEDSSVSEPYQLSRIATTGFEDGFLQSVNMKVDEKATEVVGKSRWLGYRSTQERLHVPCCHHLGPHSQCPTSPFACPFRQPRTHALPLLNHRNLLLSTSTLKSMLEVSFPLDLNNALDALLSH